MNMEKNRSEKSSSEARATPEIELTSDSESKRDQPVPEQSASPRQQGLEYMTIEQTESDVVSRQGNGLDDSAQWLPDPPELDRFARGCRR